MERRFYFTYVPQVQFQIIPPRYPVVARWFLVLLAMELSCVTLFAQTLKNMTVLSNFKHPGTEFACSGTWGWTSPKTGKEYGLMTVDSPGGLSIIDLSNPRAPAEVAFIPLGYNDNWQEVSSYRNTVYKISQSVGTGLQIIDMSPLNTGGIPKLVSNFTKYFNSAHTLFVDSVTARLFVAYGNATGVIILSLEDPLNPVEIGRIRGMAHDMTARGNRLYISTQDKMTTQIWDIENLKAPLPIGLIDHRAFNTSIGEPVVTMAHSSTLSEDGKYLFTAEEVEGTTTKVWDVSDPTKPIFISKFIGVTNVISHNLYVRGNLLFVAHNRAGLRIWDISEPKAIKELAYHMPSISKEVGSGTWGVYPWFKSGVLIHGDRELGLYVIDPAAELKPTALTLGGQGAPSAFLIHGVENRSLIFQANKPGAYTLSLYSMGGREVLHFSGEGKAGRQIIPLSPEALGKGSLMALLSQRTDRYSALISKF